MKCKKKYEPKVLTLDPGNEGPIVLAHQMNVCSISNGKPEAVRVC